MNPETHVVEEPSPQMMEAEALFAPETMETVENDSGSTDTQAPSVDETSE